MRFTGERVIPDRYELKPMLQEHLIRYAFALPHVRSEDVIDLGCGCGYGSHMLATSGARSVTAVDIDPEAVSYARQHYQAPNLTYDVMDVTALAFPAQRFTAAICLEVFEHVRDYDALLAETARVLKPNGMLILSTPNKQVWSPGRETPINPWHVREFTRDEFSQAVDRRFSNTTYYSQTTDVPGIIPFILMNLRLQRYYVTRDTLAARLLERLHGTLMKLVMLPPHIIPGAMDNDPNRIVPEHEVPAEKQYYFIAVGRAV